MHLNKSQINTANLFKIISPIYQNCFLSDMIFREQFKNGYQALDCFLINYAYERQGAPAAYPRIAHKCIYDRYKNGDNWNIPTKKIAGDLWKNYKDIAVGFNLFDNETAKIKVNASANPMNQEGGVIDKLASSKISNIAVHIRDLIANGNTYQAYIFMKSIKGIGEKISSFYLRDIAYLADLDENNVLDLHLLQPIDTWLEQTLKILYTSDVPKSLEEKQKLIVNLCKKSKVSSIAFNQGAWVFGSQIAREFGTLQRALTDYYNAQNIIEEHINKKERYLHEVINVLVSLRHTTDNSE